MNEELVKTIIHYKLDCAEKLLDRLPLKVSNSLRNMGGIIFESMDEHSKKTKTPAKNMMNSREKLNNIKIE